MPSIARAGLDPLEGLPSPLLRPASVRPVPPRRPRLFALDLEDEGGRAVAVQAAVERSRRRACTVPSAGRSAPPPLARVKRGREAAASDICPAR